MSAARRITLALIIVLGTLIAYTPAIMGGYIWDDDSYLTQNSLVRDLDGLVRIWVPGATLQYYPAVFTSFWLEHKLWGLHPAGYHIVNVLLHAANALLVWRLASRLNIPGAWAIAAVFALHPVHVESVAWITERKNVLSGLFYLASALAYLRFERPPPSLEGGGQGVGGSFSLAAHRHSTSMATKSNQRSASGSAMTNEPSVSAVSNLV